MALAGNPAHVATITVAVFPEHGGIQQLSNQPFLFALEQLFHPFVSEHEACHDSSCHTAFPVYSLLAARDFVLGTSHPQIKPK